jgi:hypothetical protein
MTLERIESGTPPSYIATLRFGAFLLRQNSESSLYKIVSLA